MIEKVLTFPNQAIPSIYGESLSYTQQLAYYMYKLNECIEQVNMIASGSLPVVSSEQNGWVLQVDNGQWVAANTMSPLYSRMLAVENSNTFNAGEIAGIKETLNGVAQMIATINGEVI